MFFFNEYHFYLMSLFLFRYFLILFIVTMLINEGKLLHGKNGFAKEFNI